MINEAFALVTSMMLAGSLAIAFVLVMRRPLRRGFGAHVVYTSWIAVPLVVMATLLPTAQRPAVAVLRASRSIIAIADIQRASVPMDWRPSLIIAWLVGVVATACLLAHQQRRFVRSLGLLQPVGDGVARAQSVDAGPVLVGAWRPLIVLPADFDTRYAPMERSLILAHERLHRRRGDARINAIVAGLRCFNWFNPLFYCAAALFRFDQELSCDVSVITRFPQARRSYAGAMLKTQLAGQLRQKLRLPVGCRWPSGHPLKERIRMLKKSQPTRMRRAGGVMLVAVFGFGGGYVAWASQDTRPTKGDGAKEMTVDADLVVTIGADAPIHARMIHPVKSPFAIAGDGTNPWRADLIASAVGDGNIELDMRILRGSSLIAAPTIVVSPGDSGVVQEGKPGEPDFLRIASTLALHESDWKTETPEVGATVGVEPVKGTLVREDVSYREKAPPVYPQAAIDAHQTGHLVIKVLVDENGEPRSAEVADTIPRDIATAFGPEAVKAVMQWRFHPARNDGKPVPAYILVPIDYALDG